MTKRRSTRTRSAALLTALTLTPMTAFVALPAHAAEALEISAIQGTGNSTPFAGKTVTTRGYVTASYPTGGFNGYVIQTPNTGGEPNANGASSALFVYAGPNGSKAEIGQYVEVTGVASEFNGLTQVSANSFIALDEEVAPPIPLTIAWPTTESSREAIEGMLFAPSGDYTVTNSYSTNQYGEVQLAFGTTPLIQPTDAGAPGSNEANAAVADALARKVTLDDATNTNFFNTKGAVPTYVSLTEPVRVGAGATFEAPVIIDYRNNNWKLNPTAPVTAGNERVHFKNTRTAQPDQSKLEGADLTVASFNVLNYFTTTGDQVAGCEPYTDRAGNPITVKSCSTEGPRGAWDAANLERQQAKLVAAINATDATIVGLMEIENSQKLGKASDTAVSLLVNALNADAGTDKWAYAASSSDLPPLAEQDVITNALIYNKQVVEQVGTSRAVGTQSSLDEPFSNAREPIGAAFALKGGESKLFVAVNHFKSKSDSEATGADLDQGDGQGAYNASRVEQANALVQWIPDALATIETETASEIEDVVLLGDFNAYAYEDPMRALYEAGYTDATKALNPTEYSYSYQGLSGSLDHVLYSTSLKDRVVGSDIWDINAPESIALEYSRYNNHGALFYAPDAYRSSDHDPVILGLKDAGTASATTTINVLNINDFHGRIDANTVKFAGTIEQARELGGEEQTLVLSAGDNIGASLFASALADDKPTIDVLNALGLAASAVGNHELDKGFADLAGRVSDQADFEYLAANMYAKGTSNPVLPTHQVFTVDGVTVGVIGAVTEETPTLVSPGGIGELEFGDPVDAVNRVAQELSDGDPANGEADVIVALYHEGAGAGTPDGSTLEEEIADGQAFARIVTQTSTEVDAIFTGHTHKQYAWMGANGDNADRPIIQTGSYGEFIGRAQLTVDVESMKVVEAVADNIARTTTDDAQLIAKYPRVAAVAQIVDLAIAEAKVVGDRPIGSVSADITTAFGGGSYVDGKYTGGTRDDRSKSSSLGNLVAQSLLETLSDPDRGAADIGVVNPGGLRQELMYAPDGSITYAEANAVLPFVNNLWTTDLTGAQVKTLLEQQWQTNADGTIPSRPYLQLGLSDNLTYTYDETRALGDRITSISLDGQPLNPQESYTVATFSFLAQGGDNFRVLAQGSNTKDTGLIDRDAWIAYLTGHPNLEPNFARSAMALTELPVEATVGQDISFVASDVDVYSLGAPANRTLEAQFVGGALSEPVSAGSFSITDGAAQVQFTVPQGAAGATTLKLVAPDSQTTAWIPLAVAEAPAQGVATTTTVKVGKSVAGAPTRFDVTITAESKVSSFEGVVELRSGETVLATLEVPKTAKDKDKDKHNGKSNGKKKSNGKSKGTRKATVSLDAVLPAGVHDVVAVYVPALGSETEGSQSATVTVKTRQATSQVKATPVKERGKVTAIDVQVSGAGISPTGEVSVLLGKDVVATAQLEQPAQAAGTKADGSEPDGTKADGTKADGARSHGKGKPGSGDLVTVTVRIALPELSARKGVLDVRYLGDANFEGSATKVKF